MVKDTMENASDSTFVQHLLSSKDKRTLAQVNKRDWFDTNSIQFTIMLFNHLYEYLGKKLNLPDKYDKIYWKNLSQAKALIQSTLLYHNVYHVNKKLLGELQAILKKKWEPLAFAKHINSIAGNIKDNPKPWTARNDTNN